jgi:hypothetical protein
MFFVSRALRRYGALPTACIAALILAACAAPPPDAGAFKVALAESPELTLRVVNTHDGAIRISGPAGNTFDILEGESVDLRFVVVAVADFQETFFRPWLVPAGPIVQKIAELDEPGLMTTSGLDVEIHYLTPDRSRAVIRGSARRCPGAGWRAAGVSETEFVVRTASASPAPIPLCPGAGA